MFLLLSRYVKPLAEIDRWLSEHRDFLDKHYAAGDFLVSGPLEPRTGGVIVTTGLTRAEVEALMKDDPFLREGVAEYDYVEFRPTKHAAALAGALRS